MNKASALGVGSACVILLLAGVSNAAAADLKATAKLSGKAGTKVSGVVTFSEHAGTVTVDAHLTGVAAGKHGFHIHEKGDCGDVDFKNAGGHFNPTGAQHGAPGEAQHHAGDLGNIDIDANGHGTLQISSAMLTVTDGPNSVVGKAVIVHEKADDLKTQPTGDAGARVACGVVKADQ